MEKHNISLSNSTAADLARVQQILGWVTFAVGLPSILLSIYMLSQLVRAGNGTPAQAINLLVSDIFNLITRPHTTSTSATLSEDSGAITLSLDTDIPSLIFYFGVASNVVFMVGVAQERHLRVASQRCHGCCRRAKQSSAISLAIWAAPVGMVLLLYFGYHAAFLLCLLLPFPLLLLFLLDACRAVLCCSSSSSSSSSSSRSLVAPSRAERRRVLAMLLALFGNYTVLFLPFALTTLLAVLEVQVAGFVYFGLVANMLLYLSPVVNPFLSLLLTRSLRELLDTFPCCRKRGGTFDATIETTSTTTSPVVFENFGVTLPFSNTGSCGGGNPLVSAGPSMFSAQGMGTSPNGISTIFGSLTSPGGMSSTFPQVPSGAGGLASVPNVGAETHGQSAMGSGNPMTLPSTPKDPDTGITLPLSNTGNCGNTFTNACMFSAQGIGTAVSNGITAVFGNCNTSNPGGMSSMFPQAPPVCGGLAAVPNVGAATHGQDAMLFGNPMALGSISEDPDTTSTESGVSTRL